MRSHEERVAAVQRRVAELERRKKIRRARILAGSAIAASLALIVGLANMIPRMVANVAPPEAYDDVETAASMFSGNVVLGYAVIALIAFVLGVCVTILCFRIRVFHWEDREAETSDGGAC